MFNLFWVNFHCEYTAIFSQAMDFCQKLRSPPLDKSHNQRVPPDRTARANMSSTGSDSCDGIVHPPGHCGHTIVLDDEPTFPRAGRPDNSHGACVKSTGSLTGDAYVTVFTTEKKIVGKDNYWAQNVRGLPRARLYPHGGRSNAEAYCIYDPALEGGYFYFFLWGEGATKKEQKKVLHLIDTDQLARPRPFLKDKKKKKEKQKAKKPPSPRRSAEVKQLLAAAAAAAAAATAAAWCTTACCCCCSCCCTVAVS